MFEGEWSVGRKVLEFGFFFKNKIVGDFIGTVFLSIWEFWEGEVIKVGEKGK